MMRFVETLWLVFFLAGLLLLGVFGTWSETAPFWYGAGLIAVAGVGTLVARQSKPAERVGWSGMAVMALLASYLGWRGLTSEVRWLARQDLVFAGTALVGYGLMAVRFTTPRSRLAVLAVLFLLIAGNTGIGLYQYFVDPRWTVFRLFDLKRAAEVSAGGFFESGNHLAGFMTLAGLPLLGVAVLGRGLNGLIRSAATAGFILAGTGVAFSTSRGGAAGFFGGMGLLIILCGILGRGWDTKKHPSRRSSGGLGWWLLTLGVAFFGLLAAAGFVLKRFFGTGNMTNLSGRGAFWDAALEQWQTAPLTGTGARSYEYMERGFRTLETSWLTWNGEIDAIFAHNDYLQCLGDYGLIGLGLVLLVTGWHFLTALLQALRMIPFHDYRPRDGLAMGLTTGAVAALAGLMIQALVEFNLHIGINAVMTGLLLGILVTPGFRQEMTILKPHGDPDPKLKAGSGICGRRLATSGVTAAISLLLLEGGWRLAPADFAWRQGRKQIKTAISLPELIAASGSFQKATTLDPENGQAWYLRGLVTLQTASLTAEMYARPFYESALTQLEQSLQLNPYNPYAAAQAGSVAGYLGRLDLAEGHFATALRWGQNIQSVLELYGDYLMRRKQYEKAIGYLVSSLNLIGNQDIRNNLQRKIQYCLKQLKQQGIAPPPEAFIPPSTPLPGKP